MMLTFLWCYQIKSTVNLAEMKHFLNPKKLSSTPKKPFDKVFY